MKKTTQISILILVFLILGSINVYAQSKLKVGHINTAELLKIMPGRDSAEKALYDYAAALEQQMSLMTKEFETKYQEYLDNESKMTQIVKNAKQKELTDLQNRILEFQELAQEDLKKMEAKLVEPLLKKAENAIHTVAKEKGYTYILDTSSGAVLYFEDADDIMPLVKKKLGIE